MPFPVVCSGGGSTALARWITDPGERVRAGPVWQGAGGLYYR